MDKHVRFLINAAYYGVIGILIILFFRYGFHYIMPFFIGFLIAYAFRKPIAIFSEHSGMSKKMCSILIITLVIVILALLLIILGVKVVDWAKIFFTRLPIFYARNIEPYVTELLQWYEHFDIIDELGPTIGSVLESTANNILSSIGSLVSGMSVRIVSLTTNLVSNLPSLLMRFLTIIISAYFISFDYDRIVAFIKRQLSPKTVDYCVHFKNHFIHTVGKYLISYMTILFLTFIELSILFTIARVERPVLVAAGVAIFDIMPIVGTSTVMIPWMIIDVLTNNYKQAIILLVGFIAMQIIRQFAEPRIVGNRVGLHPVLALICMYVGLRTVGILGMFGLPITLVVLIEMQKAGLIHIYKEEPQS